jgi:hypothetical protein
MGEQFGSEVLNSCDPLLRSSWFPVKNGFTNISLSEEWFVRYAAMAVIASANEWFKTMSSTKLDEYICVIVTYLKDPVRFLLTYLFL